jgi:hypothetical protein
MVGNDPQTLYNMINRDTNRLQAYQYSNSDGTDMFSDS